MVVEYANYLQSRGHDVSILVNQVTSIFPVRAPIGKICKGGSKIHTILYALFNKYNTDIIIADIIIMAFFLSFRNRKSLIYFAQDYDEAYYKTWFMKVLIRIVYYYCLAIRKIPVIAVHNKLERLFRTRYNTKVSINEYGIDREVFFPDKDGTYLSLKGKQLAILVFARNDYRKGFDAALQVLSAFTTEIESGSVVVWAVGDEVKAPFKMHHFGVVSPEILRKILSCSDVLLYPSRHEGFGLLVLEAMACGCPVVTTEAVPFVRNGIDAFQCRVDDSAALISGLNQMLSNQEIRSVMVENGYKTAKIYDLKQSVRKFEDCLFMISENR